MGAMAAGRTRIEGLLESADTSRTLAAVRALGASVCKEVDAYTIVGAEWHSPPTPVDCGNSGTSARLLAGAAAGLPITVTLTGDESLRGRPMDRVIAPLQRMGARITGQTHLPITIKGAALSGTRIVNETASAQVKSAILLAGLRAKGEVVVTEPRPTRDHTERLLRDFGVAVEEQPAPEGRIVRLGAERRLRATSVRIAGDPSSAAFPLVATLLTEGSSLVLPAILANPRRWGLIETLREMGASIVEEDRREFGSEETCDLRASFSLLHGVDVPADRAPSMIDEYPILAVAAACARGVTVMRGLAELRLKESDRLGAIAAGLRACGVGAAIEGDTLIVEGCDGPPAGGACVTTSGDHRIGMAFLVLGLAAQRPVTIDRAEMIETSFPGFVGLMRGLGARMEEA